MNDLQAHGVLVRRLVLDKDSASGMRLEFVPYEDFLDQSDPILVGRIRELEAQLADCQKLRSERK